MRSLRIEALGRLRRLLVATPLLCGADILRAAAAYEDNGLPWAAALARRKDA